MSSNTDRYGMDWRRRSSESGSSRGEGKAGEGSSSVSTGRSKAAEGSSSASTGRSKAGEGSSFASSSRSEAVGTSSIEEKYKAALESVEAEFAQAEGLSTKKKIETHEVLLAKLKNIDIAEGGKPVGSAEFNFPLMPETRAVFKDRPKAVKRRAKATPVEDKSAQPQASQRNFFSTLADVTGGDKKQEKGPFGNKGTMGGKGAGKK